MIEHKYLNWLKWTGRVIKLFSFIIGIAFNTSQSRLFQSQLQALLSRHDSFESPLSTMLTIKLKKLSPETSHCDLHVRAIAN